MTPIKKSDEVPYVKNLSILDLPDEILLEIWLKSGVAAAYKVLPFVHSKFNRVSKLPTLAREYLPSLTNIVGKKLRTKLEPKHAIPRNVAELIKHLKLSNPQNISYVKDNFSHLESLDLSNSSVTGEEIRNLPKELIRLDLSNCSSLFDIDLKYIRGDQMTHLILKRTHLRSPTLKCLPRKLTHLDLSNCRLLKIVDELKDLPDSITDLNLTGCFFHGRAPFKKLPESLIRLNLENASFLKSGVLRDVPETVKWVNLKTRDYFTNQAATDRDLEISELRKRLPEAEIIS